MEKIDSREISWRFVTVDTRLEVGECELLCAYLVASGATTDTHIYDGTDTTGEKIVTLVSAAATGHMFKPKEPVFCSMGLYIDVGTDVTGVLVQWRKL
jgi:hypothetical protein